MMRKITRAQYKIMPWKNGGGSTAEIDREPSGENYHWRLSQATVASDGPFSLFPGFDRWLCVWRGGELWLNGQKLEAKTPILFSGEEPMLARVRGGEVLDVGLIFDREKISAEMTIVRGIVAGALGVHYLFDLNTGDTLRFDGAFTHTVEEAILIRLMQDSRSRVE